MRHVLFTLLCIAFTSQSYGQLQSDVADLAANLAPQIKAKVVAKFQRQQQIRIAVFPFGNSAGKITRDVYAPNKYLQGELIIALRKSGLPRGMFVLDKSGLAREFQSSNVDPASINSGNPRETGTVLQRLGIDLAVVGTLDIGESGDTLDANLSQVNVTVTLIYADGTADTLDGELARFDSDATPNFPTPEVIPSDRLIVELLARHPQTQRFEELELVTTRNPGSQKVVFCIIPEWVPVGTDQAQYRVRIKNTGTPPVGRIENPDTKAETERLFAVVLTVDGVNSFYQDQGDGEIGPVVRHPKNCKRWVLSGPGNKIVPDNASPNGYQLQPVTGPGSSVIEVPGFQKNNQFADSFIFVKARESIAESIGITNDIGVIEAHFYQERLPDDRQPMTSVMMRTGTNTGPQVENLIFGINFPKYERPGHVVRIFYGQEQQCPIPAADRIPVTN